MPWKEIKSDKTTLTCKHGVPSDRLPIWFADALRFETDQYALLEQCQNTDMIRQVFSTMWSSDTDVLMDILRHLSNVPARFLSSSEQNEAMVTPNLPKVSKLTQKLLEQLRKNLTRSRICKLLVTALTEFNQRKIFYWLEQMRQNNLILFDCDFVSKYFMTPDTSHAFQSLPAGIEISILGAMYPRQSEYVCEHLPFLHRLIQLLVDSTEQEKTGKIVMGILLESACQAGLSKRLAQKMIDVSTLPQAEFVYLVESDFIDYTKVGQTEDPRRRLTEYKTYIVSPKMTVFHVPDGVTAEKLLLKEFKEHIIQGEMVQKKATSMMQDFIVQQLKPKDFYRLC